MLEQGAVVEDGVIGHAVPAEPLVVLVTACEQRSRVVLVVGGDALLVAAGGVFRGRTGRADRERVVSEGLLNFHVVEKGPVVILLEVALAVLETTGEGITPTAVEPAGGVTQRGSGKSEAANFLFDRSLARRFNARCDDVDGSTDGRQGELRGTEATLNLHGLGHQIQPKPIVPIHCPAFHVIDGDAVDQHRHVSLLEAADGNRRAVVVGACLGGIDPRRAVQNHRDGLRTQFLLDLNGFDVRESDGRLALNGNVGNDFGLLQHNGAQLEVGLHQRTVHPNGLCLAFVADVLHGDVVGTVGQVQGVLAVEIGSDPCSVDQYTGLDQSLTRDGIGYHPGHLAGLCPNRCTQQQGQARNCQSLHSERVIG